jgi:ketosteroid isomerase-like protein
MTSEKPTTDVPVDLVRRGTEAFNRRDFDTMMSIYGPASVWDGSRWGMGTFEGSAAIRDFIEDWMVHYEELEIELEELLELGKGVVFLVARQNARAVDSDDHVQLREAYVSVWAGNVVVRMTAYPDIDEARAAAQRAVGLSE